VSLTQASAFGTLLKQYRQAASLTQEALAERANVSIEAVGTLERGTRQSPRLETIKLLAEALCLSEQQHAALVTAAPRHRRPHDIPDDAPQPDPALATLFPPAQALPVPLVSPIGRERELDAVTALLRGDARLLILTGPGGAGKALLALHAAYAARDLFPDGLAYLPLAALPDPTTLAAAHARLLAVRDLGGQALPDTALDSLQGKRRLLVLDNYERIAPAAPLLADLCAACPLPTLLVISRVALHVRGGMEVAVPPLALPDRTPRPAVAELTHYPAVRIFVERAGRRVGFRAHGGERGRACRALPVTRARPTMVRRGRPRALGGAARGPPRARGAPCGATIDARRTGGRADRAPVQRAQAAAHVPCNAVQRRTPAPRLHALLQWSC